MQLAAKGSNSLPIIRELLQNSSVEIRWWATRSLAEIHDSQVTTLLLQALNDQASEVRQCAALGLRQQPDAGAIPQLINTLSDPDRLLARLAGDALIATGEEAVPALIEVMQNGSQIARLETARALSEIGDTRAIPSLFNALDEDSVVLEHWAGEGLQKMGVGMVFFKP